MTNRQNPKNNARHPGLPTCRSFAPVRLRRIIHVSARHSAISGSDLPLECLPGVIAECRTLAALVSYGAMGIFSGVRILDLTRLLPGAYCSLLLGDLGAEVIKVEEPGIGDYALLTPPQLGASGMGAAFLMLNRNKQSLTLNLKHEDGQEVFRRLAADADVVLESFRPGVMRRLGLDYEALRAVNPRLIYCAISGYGQDGPYQDLAGHDINYLGYVGALSVTGPRAGAPVPPGVQVADIGGGSLLAAFTIASALYHRNQSGQGQMLDVSMTHGVVSFVPL